MTKKSPRTSICKNASYLCRIMQGANRSTYFDKARGGDQFLRGFSVKVRRRIAMTTNCIMENQIKNKAPGQKGQNDRPEKKCAATYTKYTVQWQKYFLSFFVATACLHGSPVNPLRRGRHCCICIGLLHFCFAGLYRVAALNVHCT